MWFLFNYKSAIGAIKEMIYFSHYGSGLGNILWQLVLIKGTFSPYCLPFTLFSIS